MRRSTTSRPLSARRPARLALLAGAATLGVGLLAAPASADPTGTAPTAPSVTPSTTGLVPAGTPMTMTVTPGSAADHVHGYAWTWQPSTNAPTYSALPACGSDAAAGGIHFVCGSSVTLRVSPEDPPSARFSVWAFDADGNRSMATTVSVNTFDAGASLYPVTHQWTTDQFGMAPPPATCGVASLTLRCVPDTAGVDAKHPNGSRPLLLPKVTQWDDAGAGGGGVSGVLTFGPRSAPAGTVAPVVDTRSSFTAGAWLTPTASPSGTAFTALAQEGLAGSGFELGVSGDGHWRFRVHTATGEASTVSAGTTSPGSAVYVAGVWDSVNREVRLYLNSGLASIVGFAPTSPQALDGPVTVGARLSVRGAAEKWTGRIGNPVVIQAAATNSDIGALSHGTFFPGSDLG